MPEISKLVRNPVSKKTIPVSKISKPMPILTWNKESYQQIATNPNENPIFFRNVCVDSVGGQEAHSSKSRWKFYAWSTRSKWQQEQTPLVQLGGQHCRQKWTCELQCSAEEMHCAPGQQHKKMRWFCFLAASVSMMCRNLEKKTPQLLTMRTCLNSNIITIKAHTAARMKVYSCRSCLPPIVSCKYFRSR